MFKNTLKAYGNLLNFSTPEKYILKEVKPLETPKFGNISDDIENIRNDFRKSIGVCLTKI